MLLDDLLRDGNAAHHVLRDSINLHLPRTSLWFANRPFRRVLRPLEFGASRGREAGAVRAERQVRDVAAAIFNDELLFARGDFPGADLALLLNRGRRQQLAVGTEGDRSDRERRGREHLVHRRQPLAGRDVPQRELLFRSG